MVTEFLPLIPLFFLIALIYSAAGFGGGSSYLAVLTLFPLEYTSIRFIALLCNIAVVSGSVFLFYKNDLIPFKKVWPLIILSIPLAFLGGSFLLDEDVFFIVLGIVLILASCFMMMVKNGEVRHLPPYSNGIIGGGIGFLSGLVGIGGGIFLSPVLFLTKWHVPKSITATTALFILLNSLAGLAGQFSSGLVSVNFSLLMALILSVFLGGQIGSRLTIFRMNPSSIRSFAAVLIFIVGIRILYQYGLC